MAVPEADASSPVEVPRAPKSIRAPLWLPTGPAVRCHFDGGSDGVVGNIGFAVYAPDGSLLVA